MKDKTEEALNGIKKLTGDDNVQFIDENDTFTFECKQCGQCCMHRRDIILNPFDVYNGAKYLGITPSEFLNKYTYSSFGGYSKIPMVLLDTSENGFCPLLKFDIKDGGKFKCTINPAKPGACSNHPIGVGYEKNTTDNTTEYLFIKVNQCDNSQKTDKQQTVKEWIKPYTDNLDSIQVAHEIQTLCSEYFNPREFYFLLNIFLDKSQNHEYPKDMKESFNEFDEMIKKTAHMYFDITVGCGYSNYEIDKDFVSQAHDNIKMMSEAYKSIGMLFTTLKDAFEKVTGTTLEDFINEMEGEQENND